jgi:tetrahydromethanopterin S-methyltransferase subunit A
LTDNVADDEEYSFIPPPLDDDDESKESKEDELRITGELLEESRERMGEEMDEKNVSLISIDVKNPEIENKQRDDGMIFENSVVFNMIDVDDVDERKKQFSSNLTSDSAMNEESSIFIVPDDT